MIYLDASVVLAALLLEDRRPPAAFWQQEIAASRLTAYEVWNRLHAHRAPAEVLEESGTLLSAIDFVELTSAALARALEPFPQPVRTLDGLHLATADFLRSQGRQIDFATYDRQLGAAARAMKFPLVELT